MRSYMPKTDTSLNYSLIFRIASLFLFFAILLACSNDSPPKNGDGDGSNGDDNPIVLPDSVVFTVIGDVPYDDEQRTGLIGLVANHNTNSDTEFIVHVGDIKPGAVACDEMVYQDVSEILSGFNIPTFIVMGDNEFNDCDDPEQGFAFWNQYFLHFNEKWPFSYPISYQEERSENFSWIQKKVLFIGINLVGSVVHDAEEWNTRLADDGNWIEQLMETNADTVEAVVVFGHANNVNIGPEKFEIFTTAFRSASAQFGKPVLYIHGDGHFWIQDRPWQEQNIQRVQIEGGADALRVTIKVGFNQPFIFDRTFLE